MQRLSFVGRDPASVLTDGVVKDLVKDLDKHLRGLAAAEQSGEERP